MGAKAGTASNPGENILRVQRKSREG
ncbi:hypothetical protein LINPERHAP1_LOCUS15550 [Linum perenne]